MDIAIKAHGVTITLSLGEEMKARLQGIEAPADLQKVLAVGERRLRAVASDFANYIFTPEGLADICNQEAAQKGEEDSADLLDMVLATRNECMR
jgi:hypothetical protein